MLRAAAFASLAFDTQQLPIVRTGFGAYPQLFILQLDDTAGAVVGFFQRYFHFGFVVVALHVAPSPLTTASSRSAPEKLLEEIGEAGTTARISEKVIDISFVIILLPAGSAAKRAASMLPCLLKLL